MMSTFGGGMRLVKTRKPHRCETCDRTIPTGTKAYYQGGMYEGNWQNWHMCQFCHDKEVFDGDCVTGYEFSDWLTEQDFFRCPACRGVNPKTGEGHLCHTPWRDIKNKWSEDQKTLLLECMLCGHKWSQYIGWGDEEEE